MKKWNLATYFGRMARRRILTAVVVGCLCGGLLLPSAHATNENLTEFGDFLTFALPLTGLGTTVVLRDWDGTLQWGASLATSGAITGIMKTSVDKSRPDAGLKSFPSGHATGAFSGAAFIQRRYGWWAGTPAYALAGVCAYSRVDANRHDWFDVFFGGVSGVFGAYVWTEPYQVGETSVMFKPWAGSDYVGLQLTAWNDHNLFDSKNLKPSPKGAAGPKGDSSYGNGNDPTDIYTLIDTGIYVEDASGQTNVNDRFSTGYGWRLGGKYAVSENQMLSAEAMLLSNRPYDEVGLSDTKIGYLWRYHQQEEWTWWKPTALAVGADLSMPTGDYDEFYGTGSWIVRPKLTGAWKFFDNVTFLPEFAWYQSFDEKSTDDEISMLGMAWTVQYQFPDAFYLSWKPEYFISAKGEANDSANHLVEIGYPLESGWVPFLQYQLIGNSKWVYNPPPERERYYYDSFGLGVRKIF